MVRQSADPQSIQRIFGLANDPDKVGTTGTVEYDMMGRGLTKHDVCDILRDWIAQGNEVQQTTMRGQDAGAPGYEIKPTINNVLFYIKVVVRYPDTPDEMLYIVSVHPNR
ncbi:MAG: hypothetical protein NT049_03925 [Planctomycetota bacterium]|nr:hypothetical protein [Planctomycetota bacterium]